MSPGGLRGLQLRWGALVASSVGSTPMRSRQNLLIFILNFFILLPIHYVAQLQHREN